ncbi:hypothetical protein A2Z33_05255 [Candidatus Gottesmanbacteria bacterium RBG_16_52_11]|uniref:Nudix hydrolase domain-containing protein n=1 Tax=Candidatus Gottesmanbacteria bacterium RBG_16_52_11 TaxID=1798374 RepID=A0A1F5YR15_9BACT|nr:MAG: hypothetical protein A2Z33_05255 [Candidatus Gottesmanbacteria bacterium RBG_16_52_11]
MKLIKSAGGVVICRRGNTRLVLIITDMNGQLTFPKGEVAPGETDQAAAEREVREETGVMSLKLIIRLGSIKYTYRRGELIKKTVHYFLFETDYIHNLVPQTNEGISKVSWIRLSSLRSRIGYQDTNLKLVDSVLRLAGIRKNHAA